MKSLLIAITLLTSTLSYAKITSAEQLELDSITAQINLQFFCGEDGKQAVNNLKDKTRANLNIIKELSTTPDEYDVEEKLEEITRSLSCRNALIDAVEAGLTDEEIVVAINN